jgi:acetoin utilization deacetylase AcuC-like enzyme
MPRTGLVLDPRFRDHLTGPGHPERPDRLLAIEKELRQRGLIDRCAPIPATPIDPTLVQHIHAPDYLIRLERACAQGRPFIDVPDSAICPASFDIARLAAGAAVIAVDRVIAGDVTNAFCAIRPPGHHAERNRSMGFCLLNNIAIAAQHLLDDHGLARVAIVDWDVHHGNATQHSFESDPRVLFISLHGHPGVTYPGTGYAHERGVGAGEGFTINIPMLPSSGDAEYRKAFDEQVLPALDKFRPEFLLISAGFDAHRDDPLGGLMLTEEGFATLTRRVKDLAAESAHGRIISLLEGGYDLEALEASVAAHVSALAE